MTEADAREVAGLARRIYRVLTSRLPEENSDLEFVVDRMARLQAKDALETLLALVDRSLKHADHA